jgi:hypothetical protein
MHQRKGRGKEPSLVGEKNGVRQFGPGTAASAEKKKNNVNIPA